MSRQAIAAVLAREDLVSGERLAAFSLASFASRENRAWPGAAAAALRAGLSRSRYLQARDRLVRRGLVRVEDEASGRGRSSTLALVFAERGPWWEGEINVELFEAVLGYSSARGPGRLLLAAIAAIADADGGVWDLATEQLRAAAGVSDRTYRRARKELLSTGELVLVNGVGGRGNRNVWTVSDPGRRDGTEAARATRQVAPPAGARPLVAVTDPIGAGCVGANNDSAEETKGGHDQTVSAQNSPILTGVYDVKGGQAQTVWADKRPAVTGVSDGKGGQDRTLFELPAQASRAERAAESPAQTPAPNARAGRKAVNPRTPEAPPNPPEGGSPPDSMLIEQTYATERGRARRRRVLVDLTEVRRGLGQPEAGDRADWERIRVLLVEAVGEGMFEIRLEPLELIATGVDRTLVIAAPPATERWVSSRFCRLLSTRAESVGRAVRFADEPERVAFGSNHERASGGGRALEIKQQEVS
jgi:hypothetical protein